jgi:hypothetical protein
MPSPPTFTIIVGFSDDSKKTLTELGPNAVAGVLMDHLMDENLLQITVVPT